MSNTESNYVTLWNRTAHDIPVNYKGSVIVIPSKGKQRVVRNLVDLANLPSGISHYF